MVVAVGGEAPRNETTTPTQFATDACHVAGEGLQEIFFTQGSLQVRNLSLHCPCFTDREAAERGGDVEPLVHPAIAIALGTLASRACPLDFFVCTSSAHVLRAAGSQGEGRGVAGGAWDREVGDACPRPASPGGAKEAEERRPPDPRSPDAWLPAPPRSGWATCWARPGAGKEGGEFSGGAACPDPSGSGAGAGREVRAAGPGPPGVLSLGDHGRGTCQPAGPEQGRDTQLLCHPPLSGGSGLPSASFSQQQGCQTHPRPVPRFESWTFLLEPLKKSLSLSERQPSQPEVYLSALLGSLDQLRKMLLKLQRAGQI